MNKKQILIVVLIAFFIGAIGSIITGRFFIPYLASATGWESLNKLATNSPIIVNRTQEVQLNEGVNLIDLTKQAGNITASIFDKSNNPAYLANGIIMTSDGLIFTSKSFLGNRRELTVVLHNGNSYTGLVRAVDPKSDIAAITIEERNLTAPSFSDARDLNVAQRVVVIGYSNTAFNRKFATGFVTNTVSNTKSQLGRTYSTEVLEDAFETDAEVNTGEFIGSPIINLNGRLVGMVAGGSIQKIVTAENLQTALNSYLSSGKIIRPRLGITYFELSKNLSSLRGLASAGALVAQVDAGSPAAGKIMVNDLIVEVDGRSLENQSFEQVINQHAIGDAKFTLLRAGKEMDVTVKLDQTK